MKLFGKRIPLFYCIYTVLLIVIIAAIHLSMLVVNDYLADFESAQPEYEAERVFAAYYGGSDFSLLLGRVSPSLTPYETKSAVERYLQSFTEGKEITFSEISTGLDESIRYIVKAGDVKFSAFTLKPSGKTTDKGVALYEADAFELYCSGDESVRILAPKGYSVLLNGVLLEDSAKTGGFTRDKTCDFMPEGVDGILYMEYLVDGLYFAPDTVTVVAPDGQLSPVQTLSDGTYSAAIVYDQTLPDLYGQTVLETAETIAMYMQKDTWFYRVSPYVDPESELYDNLQTSQTYFVIDHDSYAFEDVKLSEFFAYDENTFSCRVTFTHVLKRTYSEDYRDYIDTTYFFRRVGDKFLVYDRYNH